MRKQIAQIGRPETDLEVDLLDQKNLIIEIGLIKISLHDFIYLGHAVYYTVYTQRSLAQLVTSIIQLTHFFVICKAFRSVHA